jgi:RHS repeat-associated protein
MDTVVQINGSGFGAAQGSSTLTFYANSAATPITWSDTLITAKVPSTAISGVVGVTVGGVTSSSTIDFNVPPPQITNVSPNRGTAGAQITVTGSGFHSTQGGGALYYSNSQQFSIVSWSPTQIVANVQSFGSTGGLRVYQNGGFSNSDVMFTFGSPFITGVSPASGPVGTQVQINGSGFGATQGSSSVGFRSIAASIISWSDTQIIATVPTGAGSGTLTVSVASVTSNTNINFTVPTPKITSLSPTSGVIGTTVTINGSGFQSAEGIGSVAFSDGHAAPILSWSDTQIVVQVPSTAISGAVRVQVNNSDQSNQNFAFTLPNPFVTGLVPSRGPAGTQVQVNGTGFGATQGSSTLAFGTVSATVVSWSDTQIIASVPNGVGNSNPVKVTEGGILSNTNVNFFVPAPTITSVSPTIGGGGNPVTITGTGFQSAQGQNSYVTFSNFGAAGIRSWSDTQIVAVVPPSATTTSIDVFANGGISNYVTYTVPANAISTVSPNTGPVGTQVTISGVAFGATQGTSALTFNGQPAASIVSWSATQIVATVPVTATSGPVIVRVNNANSDANHEFAVPPPQVFGLSPQGGIVGTTVTINGSGFQASQRDSTITFNGVTAVPSSWTDTQIVATVPAGATTGEIVVHVNSTYSVSGRLFEVPNLAVASLTPPEVPVGGTITITGSGFGPSSWISPDGRSVVYIASILLNGVSLGAASWSDTSITASLPGNVTSGSLTVTRYNATSNGIPITIIGAPVITALTPSTGPVNGSVVISGSNFGSAQYQSTVQFNGNLATVTSWSDSQITAVVPPGTETGPAWVTIAGVNAPSQNFTINTSAQITDSLGRSSSYTSVMLGGSWLGSDSQGSGCSSCTVRGTIHNDFDPVGNLLATTDELLHKTDFTYDANGNVASQTAHLDTNTPVATSYTYNSFGEPLTVTDPLGNVTTNTYDANGNLLTVTSPKPDAPTAASVTQFAYDAKGQLTQITDPLSHITTLAYYPTGLIHTITDAQSNVTSYEYDLRGNRTAVVDAQQNRTTFAYDLGNRLTGITYPDTTSVSFAYDGRGRRTSMTDQNGKVTSYAYDDADRLTSVTDAAQHVTTYAYDLENNLLSITDAAQHTTSFVYDAFGRVTQTAFPSSLNENYVYDAVGNLTSKVDRKNQTILYVYDALNRLTHKGYPDATGVDYVYDLAGKIKQVTDTTGTYGFAYDNMGRLIGTTTQYAFLPGTPAPTFSNSYAYDAASNRTSFTAPDGSTNTYAYDTLNRLGALTDSGAGQFTIGYDALGRRTQLARPNGITTSYAYDSVSHLQSILHKLGVNTLDGATYGYDLAGNRTSKVNQLNSVVLNFGYDNLYQLTGVTQAATSTEAYTFDPVGNRLSSLSVSSYSYNGSNQVTAGGSSSSYTYDNNGNTLTKNDGTGTTTFTWDFENRLTSVHPSGQTTVTFKYDPFGKRIQKGGSAYVYDGSNLIEEVDAGGNLAAHYVFGSGVDEPLAAYRGTTWEFYQADGTGSITSLSTPSGTISDSFVYDSFGNVASSTGVFAQPFRYTGREWDAETGLYYYRARYYDSISGRFLSEDPLQFNAGNNFYEYSYNSPASFSDPSGLQPAPAYVPPPPASGLTLIQGGGGATGGASAGVVAATVGLVVLDAALLGYDVYQGYKLGAAYGWWKPFLDSGNMQQLKDPARAKCQTGCPPCVPPVGSLRHRVDQVPPSRPHKPWPSTHWHVEQMHQQPAPACTCRWIEIANGQGPVPPGVPHQ